VCTNRGQHDRTRLGHLTDARDKPIGLSEETAEKLHKLSEAVVQDSDFLPKSGPRHGIVYSTQRGRRTRRGWAVQTFTDPVEQGRADGGHRFRFPCPTCGRNIEIREERLAGILDRFYEHTPDARDLDVSYHD
jgi:hypothetical protein